MIQTFELLVDSLWQDELRTKMRKVLWQDKLRTIMTGWKSSQRSDSGRTSILASTPLFYSLIQEDGYFTPLSFQRVSFKSISLAQSDKH